MASVRVEHRPDAGGGVDITEYLLAAPLFTDTGGQDVNTAEIVLRSPNGEFLTTGSIINDYDKFTITSRDDFGNRYERDYEYAPQNAAMKIDESAAVGRMITLNLLGIEYHLQRVNYSGAFRWSDAKTVSDDILSLYTANRGTRQPFVTDTGLNDLPTHTANNYPFSAGPASCWDRLFQVVTSLAAPPANGGLLDFWTNSFEKVAFNGLAFKSRSLGSSPARPVTITSGILSGGEDDRESGRSPPNATRIIGQFENAGGSLPVNFQRYQGLKERFLNVPVYQSGVEYRPGELIRIERGGGTT